MGKKKPFIDKKKASTYHLLHRSQRDVAGDHAAAAADEEGATPLQQQSMVLWPADQPTNQKQPSHNNQAVVGSSTSSSTLAAWRAKLQAAGLLDVDHERYLKPISGTGTFLDGATGRAVALDSSSSRMSTTQQHSAEDALLEVDRQFDSIPLTAEFMDEDIAAALFGDFDEGDFEELNDDFILDAAAEPEPQEAGADAAFDFDEHIQRLVAQAARERQQEPGKNGSKQQHPHEYGQEDQAYFSNLRPLHERDNDDDDDEQQSFGYGTTVATEPGVVAKLNPDEERALCEKFEATLAEYDDDDSDGCDGFDEDDDGHGDMLPKQEEMHGGLRPLEGDAVVEAALDDFLQEKEDDIFIRGTRYLEENKKRGGSGFSVLVGTRMVPARELDESAEHHPEQEPARPVEELLAQARETLAQPKQKPPPEEIFIDGKSYFSERERNPWDCESILSTYSNLDNNPTTIAANVSSRRRRQRHKKQPTASSSVQEEEEEEPVQHIRLSAKTGLPVGVLDSQHKHDDDNDAYGVDDTTTFLSINRGERRNKHETTQEKKARKLLVKRERELARLQKKMTKQVFQEEFQRRAVGSGDGDVAGQTVFRF